MDLKILVILVGLHIVYFIAKNVDAIVTYFKGLQKEKESSKVSRI